MKKAYLLSVITILLLSSVDLMATDWSKTKGYFDCQKDIEYDVGGHSRYSSTTCFNGRLYNFIYYSEGNKVIVRKLTLKSGLDPDVIEFNVTKDDDNPHFKATNKFHQPASVLFNGKLYCFFQDDDHYLVYTSNEATEASKDSWAAPKRVNEDFGKYLCVGGMAATVVEGKLCLFLKTPVGSDKGLKCFYTEDLLTWQTFKLGINNGGDDAERYGALSAITVKKVINNVKREIAMIGYVSPDHNPMNAKLKFSDAGVLEFVDPNHKQQTIYSNASFSYTCAALINGTVAKDPNSTGQRVQAFIKHDGTTNGLLRYRIERIEYDPELDTWTRSEPNLVKQNYRWADKGLNLTAATLSLPDGNNLKNYICVVYRGYDDFDHPLNCAYSRTDDLIYDAGNNPVFIDTLNLPKDKHYIGFIEGAPPYHINDSLNPTVTNSAPHNISTAEFEYKSGSSTETSYEMNFGLEIKAEIQWFRFEAKYDWCKKWAYETTITTTENIGLEATLGEYSKRGKYLVLKPLVYTDRFFLKDRRGNLVDTVYNFYINKENPYVKDQEIVELPDNLDSKHPETFFNRKYKGLPIDFTKFPINATPCQLTFTGYGSDDQSVEIETQKVDENKHSVELKLGVGHKDEEKHYNFEVLGVGGFKYTSTVTSTVGNKVAFYLGLNEAVDPNDIEKLQYKAHWIRPQTDTTKNWWIPADNRAAKPWCIAYEVTQIQYKNGKLLIATPPPPDAEEADPTSTSGTVRSTDSSLVSKPASAASALVKISPNPLTTETQIAFRVGTESVSGDSQSCMTRLSVIDLQGKEVTILVDEDKIPGQYVINWTPTGLKPGMYFLRLSAGNSGDVKKLIVQQ